MGAILGKLFSVGASCVRSLFAFGGSMVFALFRFFESFEMHGSAYVRLDVLYVAFYYTCNRSELKDMYVYIYIYIVSRYVNIICIRRSPCMFRSEIHVDGGWVRLDFLGKFHLF